MKHHLMERYLHILRDVETTTETFRWASNNLARLLSGKALAKLPFTMEKIQTPVGVAEGPRVDADLMLIPIFRAGLALVNPFLEAVTNVAVGSLLIQRDEETAEPILIYKKLADPLPRNVMILDPMLATAGTAVMAVNLLREEGYASDQIYFAGVIASREGYNRLAAIIPEENITLAAVDPLLNSRKYIDPGLGDYGDRYFGT